MTGLHLPGGYATGYTGLALVAQSDVFIKFPLRPLAAISFIRLPQCLSGLPDAFGSLLFLLLLTIPDGTLNPAHPLESSAGFKWLATLSAFFNQSLYTDANTSSKNSGLALPRL